MMMSNTVFALILFGLTAIVFSAGVLVGALAPSLGGW